MAAPPDPVAARATIAERLAHAFALVDCAPEHAWARAFLLDCSPAANLAVVTNRAAQPYGVTSTSVDTAFETVPPGAGREAFDSKFAFDALLVPSFAAGGIGVGVVVNRIVAVAAGGLPALGSDAKARCRFAAQVERGGPRLAPPPAAGDAAYKYSLGRYVRDERNGNLLIVKHTGPGSGGGGSGAGGTQVMYLEHLSTTRRYRMYFHCDTAQFKAGRFVDSVLACVTNTEARHCPVCRESPGANCDCKLELEPPKDAFDFRGAAKAMASQSGDYLGQAGITISLRDKRADLPAGLERPRRYVSAPLISSLRTASFCRSRCDASHDALAAVLQNFAVQTSLAEAAVDRGVSSQPAPPELLTVVQATAASGGEVVGSDVADIDVPNSDAAQDFTSTVLVGTVPDPDVAMGLQPTTDTEFIDSCLLLDPDDAGDDPDEFRNLGELNGDSLNGAFAEMADEQTTVAANNGTLSEQTPATLAGPSPRLAKGGVRGKGYNDEEVAARELRRRTKNRESAARANARKKAMNDELKANIRAAQARAAALQTRQTELVKENMALRRRVGIIHVRKSDLIAARAGGDGQAVQAELEKGRLREDVPAGNGAFGEASMTATGSGTGAGASVDAV